MTPSIILGIWLAAGGASPEIPMPIRTRVEPPPQSPYLYLYIHIISVCRDDKKAREGFQCEATAVFSDIARTKELDSIIEKHWKTGQGQSFPLRPLLDLILLINSLQK